MKKSINKIIALANNRLFLIPIALITISFLIELLPFVWLMMIYAIAMIIYKPFVFKRLKNFFLWLFIILTIILYPLTSEVTEYQIFNMFYYDPILFSISIKMSLRILLMLNFMSLLSDSFKNNKSEQLWQRIGISNYEEFSDNIDNLLPKVNSKAKYLLKEINFKTLHKLSLLDLFSRSLAELLIYPIQKEDSQ